MKLIAKGLIIGIGKIIPGVSGAMLAITLGVYERILFSLANLKKEFFANAKFLTKIGIGIILSIILTSKIVVKCLKCYYFPTMLLFIGMIIGGIPNLLKKVKFKKQDIIVSFISLVTLSFMFFNNNTVTNLYEIEYTIIDFIKLIGVGFIDAISSIIPGISGTALLMMIGYYNIILKTFGSILNISQLAQNIFTMIPFSIGFLLGIIIISKILNLLFKKFKNTTYIIITIFMTLTTIILIKNTFEYMYTTTELLIGISLLIIGYIISLKLDNE